MAAAAAAAFVLSSFGINTSGFINGSEISEIFGIVLASRRRRDEEEEEEEEGPACACSV